MLLSEFLTYQNVITVEILQEAYYDVVRKLSLNPMQFPVALSGIAGCDEFNLKAALPNDSEVAIKNIDSISGCRLTTDVSISGAKGELQLGNPTSNTYGFANFTSLNDSHTTIPAIHQYENTFYCEDTDPAMFWIKCYVYPYLVTVDGSDPYTDIHCYDIATMQGDNANNTLEIDDAMIFPVFAKAMSIYYQNNDDLATASRYDNIAITLINLYNRNPKELREHLPTSKILLKGYL